MMSTPAQRTPAAAPPSTSQQLSKAPKCTPAVRAKDKGYGAHQACECSTYELADAVQREHNVLATREEAVWYRGCGLWYEAVFSVEEYVKIVADTSSGMNRLKGFCWITSVRVVGAASLSDVQYDKVYDNGRTHKKFLWSTSHLLFWCRLSSTKSRARCRSICKYEFRFTQFGDDSWHTHKARNNTPCNHST